MIKKIGEKEYEFATNLRTTVAVKNAMGKTFVAVMKNIAEMGTDELLKFLYCGIVNKSEMDLKTFQDEIIESGIGLGELYDIVMEFVEKIQYPGLTKEEIDEKLQEKLDRSKKYQGENN